MQFIGVFIALFIGIAIGQDAKKRGMNGFLWGAGVFLLLIVFLPLYFIFRKPKLEDRSASKTNDEIIDDEEIS